MKDYIVHHPWEIVEDRFHPEYQRITESLMSLGNGRMGQRGNFEENYSGDTFSGNYVAGIYYPDKTRVGWWKNGYPDYFAKVLNSANWIGLDIFAGNRQLDLHAMDIQAFDRRLNMQEGILKRSFTASFSDGVQVKAQVERFCSMADDECGAIRYELSFPDYAGSVSVFSQLDFDVVNEDSNYDEKFWEEVERREDNGLLQIMARTRKLDFHVCAGIFTRFYKNGEEITPDFPPVNERTNFMECMLSVDVAPGDTLVIEKYAAVLASINYDKASLMQQGRQRLEDIAAKGYDTMKQEQVLAWKHRWDLSDIQIDGDVAAQQGIRFNIFQLQQTYTGKDKRLNIGPKGFTGEKYGGSTYWDTEAYCLPFYLSTAEQEVAKNLLIYRHNHLEKAIENAEKLGFSHGAALYPMVTMNGEECHNEWEITFEEIHRNGAIAYAIYDYIRYTGDDAYLHSHGMDVLTGIARFWAQRVNFSEEKQQYVMLGVTGPNEYENNVNNNWYTNYIARWCLRYAAESAASVARENPGAYQALHLSNEETLHWLEVAEKLYLPYCDKRKVFLQQDGFLDKELMPVARLDKKHLPLNQNWSWDRILRSCFIKQADVLQGLYFFEEDFTTDEIRRNFDFYEPMTVHESSLSPCVHVILASMLGYREKAYEMYLRTARLDLDDYNNDTEDGCHITSMAGTWMAVVKGFGGMRVVDHALSFKTFLPEQWKGFRFKVIFRGAMLQLEVSAEKTRVDLLNDVPADLILEGKAVQLNTDQSSFETSRK
jgi:maltose phosphorylase